MPPPSSRPLVFGARREALIVAAVWLATMSYNAWYGYTHAQGRTLENITFVFGFPDWIFWGFVVPWFVCLAFQYIFAYFIMKDDPLGEDETAGIEHSDSSATEVTPG